MSFVGTTAETVRGKSSVIASVNDHHGSALIAKPYWKMYEERGECQVVY